MEFPPLPEFHSQLPKPHPFGEMPMSPSQCSIRQCVAWPLFFTFFLSRQENCLQVGPLAFFGMILRFRSLYFFLLPRQKKKAFPISHTCQLLFFPIGIKSFLLFLLFLLFISSIVWFLRPGTDSHRSLPTHFPSFLFPCWVQFKNHLSTKHCAKHSG